MIKAAIDKILELAPIEQFEIAGRKYTSNTIVPVLEPTPKTLTVHTLSGLVDYLTKGIDDLKDAKLTLHVASPVEVNLYGFIKDNSFCERPEFIKAIFESPQFAKNNYCDLENFIIGLQAFFVQTESSAALLKVIGNLRDEKVNQFEDDGRTQSVTAKSGIATKENVTVPNPVTLKPFRTFPEIAQPESLFVFRMKQQQGQAPACGLWEADNKIWKVEAIKSIAAWLQDKVPASVPIIA